MAVMDETRAPVLAAPRPPQARMSLRQFLRTVRDSSIATFPAEAYEKDIVARKLLWRRTFIVNEPQAIKHIIESARRRMFPPARSVLISASIEQRFFQGVSRVTV